MGESVPPAPVAPPVMESVRENLGFCGFLRKRKDTMKFTWAKYWFKLQNTTLYFYTSQEAHEVQSVRKVSVTDVEYPFEIVMKNGKRKILAADTADLRDVWMEFLWKSMQLPGPGRHLSSCTWYDIPRLLERASSASGEGLEEELRPDSPPCDHVFGHLDETPLLLHSADKGGQFINTRDSCNNAPLPPSTDIRNVQLPHPPFYCNVPLPSALACRDAFNIEQTFIPCDHRGTYLKPSYPTDGGVTMQPSYPTDGGVTMQPSYPTDGGVTMQPSYPTDGGVTMQPSYPTDGGVTMQPSYPTDGGVTMQPLYPTDGGVTTQPLYPTDGGVTTQPLYPTDVGVTTQPFIPQMEG
ncbi:uncharacterized protein LOC101732294 isoform X2 [Xenopus tropicalis]|uniref:Uncharacterized protein LOC101732294 isoform X2 n=1 Tax=Xenopus tropicalis TaxID=8364 RepID=A0A8J1J0V6_XENTR|nr:uncharacterized protein LOC101732294 isoform X2 [Xenopus tropicalis]